MKNLVIASILGFVFLFAACGKYEDGPKISLKTKKARLVGEWKVEKVLVNGVENPAALAAMNISTSEFDKDGEFTIKLGLLNFEGTWNFGDGKETIETQMEGESTKDVYTILRLTNKELWTENVDSSITYEIHSVKL